MTASAQTSLTQLVDLLGKKVPAFIGKHPAATAGLLTAGVGVDQMLEADSPAGRVENSIMRERTGGPGAKYACEELELLSERKAFLSTKVSFEKVAEDFNPGAIAGAKAVDSGISEGLGAIRRLIGAAAQAIKNKFSDEPKRKRIMQDVLTHDPVISTFENEQPGGAQEAMYTMRQFAPTLSTNPAIAKSFLRNAAMTGGPLDYQTIRGLADAESSVLKAQQQGAWGRKG